MLSGICFSAVDLSQRMGTALSVLVDATLITFVFALAALGLAVVFGLIGVINMGHGAMLTLGAYFTWFATTSGVPFLPSVLLAAAGFRRGLRDGAGLFV